MLELLVALAVLGILLAITVPRASQWLDGIAVRGAASDADAMLTSARHLAVSRAARASVEIDTAARTLTLCVGSDTVRRHDEGALHGVRITTNRTSIAYSQIGAGFGIANASIIFTKGVAAETVVVSRLGRVRR